MCLPVSAHQGPSCKLVPAPREVSSFSLTFPDAPFSVYLAVFKHRCSLGIATANPIVRCTCMHWWKAKIGVKHSWVIGGRRIKPYCRALCGKREPVWLRCCARRGGVAVPSQQPRRSLIPGRWSGGPGPDSVPSWAMFCMPHLEGGIMMFLMRKACFY